MPKYCFGIRHTLANKWNCQTTARNYALALSDKIRPRFYGSCGFFYSSPCVRPKHSASRSGEKTTTRGGDPRGETRRESAGKVCRDVSHSVSRCVFPRHPHPTRSVARHAINYLLCDCGLSRARRGIRGVPACRLHCQPKTFFSLSLCLFLPLRARVCVCACVRGLLRRTLSLII